MTIVFIYKQELTMKWWITNGSKVHEALFLNLGVLRVVWGLIKTSWTFWVGMEKLGFPPFSILILSSFFFQWFKTKYFWPRPHSMKFNEKGGLMAHWPPSTQNTYAWILDDGSGPLLHLPHLGMNNDPHWTEWMNTGNFDPYYCPAKYLY